MIRRFLRSCALSVLLGFAGCQSVSVPDSPSSASVVRPYRTEKLRDIASPYHASVTHCVFLPDSRSVLYANYFGVWLHGIGGDCDEEFQVPGNQGGDGAPIAVSRDGRTLATCRMGSMVNVWSVESRQKLITIDLGLSHRISAIAFTPDGRLVTAGFTDPLLLMFLGEVGIWDVKTGQRIHHMLAWEGPVQSVAVSPDGAEMLVGSMHAWHAEHFPADGRIRVMDVRSFRTKLTISHAHPGSVESIVYSTDGRYAASSADDGTVTVWEGKTMRRVCTFMGTQGVTSLLAFSPDGKCLAGGDFYGVRIWDLERGTERQFVPGPAAAVVAFSTDGRLVATGGKEGGLTLWQVIGSDEARVGEGMEARDVRN